MISASKTILLVTILIYILGVVAILSPLLGSIIDSRIFEFGVIYSLSFAVIGMFISAFLQEKEKGALYFVKDNDERVKTWLYLHSFNSYFFNTLIIPLYGIAILLSLVFVPNAFPMIFMFTPLMIVMIVMKMWYFHNIIGMGYTWIANGTTLGVQSYANLGKKYLLKKDNRGIRYLIDALELLQDLIKDMKLNLSQLDKTITSLRCFVTFESEIPYDKILLLSECIEKYPNVKNLPNIMNDYLNHQEISWTTTFKPTKKQAMSNVKKILLIATLLSALTFLPESTRNELLTAIRDFGSVENIQLLIGGFLSFGIAYLSSLMNRNFLSYYRVKTAFKS